MSRMSTWNRAVNYRGPLWNVSAGWTSSQWPGVPGTPLVFLLGVKKEEEEVISIVAKGILGFISDMVSPNQCLESFENRQRDAPQASTPAALAADILVHPDQRWFRNILSDPMKQERQNTKGYNHEVEHRDCTSSWEPSWANSTNCLELLPYFLICTYKVFQQKRMQPLGETKHVPVFFCRFPFYSSSQRQSCF